MEKKKLMKLVFCNFLAVPYPNSSRAIVDHMYMAMATSLYRIVLKPGPA
jgi:hypothetical protein